MTKIKHLKNTALPMATVDDDPSGFGGRGCRGAIGTHTPHRHIQAHTLVTERLERLQGILRRQFEILRIGL